MPRARLTADERRNLSEVLTATGNLANVRTALQHLRTARELLNFCPKTRARVEAAISSAKGAERHAAGRVTRADRLPRMTL